MMPELSLHILDLLNNALSAQASYISTIISIHTETNQLIIQIKDNGHGMTQEQLSLVCDPFYTTRTTRTVGLGIPFFRQAALMTNGSFDITSSLSNGTTIKAIFVMSHIDCMPLGDITDTIHSFIICNSSIHFHYEYSVNNRTFTLDTKEILTLIGDLPITTPSISIFIKDYLLEQKHIVDGNALIN